MTRLLALVAGALLLASSPVPAQAQDARLVRLSAGSPAGVYLPVAIALCRLVNEQRPVHGIRCAAKTSDGSLDNLERLRAGDADLAIVQSDVQAEAAGGTGDLAFDGLRAVMSLYPESVTIVTRADASITSLDALAGKRVSAGPAGSGQREMWNALMEEQDWTADDFAALLDLSSTDQASALCGDRIDAFVATIGHPALTVQEATLSCDAMIVPAEGPAVDRLIAGSPAFVKAEIPGDLYRGIADPVPSYGVTATVVTREDIPEELISIFVGSALSNLDRLRRFDPSLANLSTEEMAASGLTAPLHSGAAQAYDAATVPAPGN